MNTTTTSSVIAPVDALSVSELAELDQLRAAARDLEASHDRLGQLADPLKGRVAVVTTVEDISRDEEALKSLRQLGIRVLGQYAQRVGSDVWESPRPELTRKIGVAVWDSFDDRFVRTIGEFPGDPELSSYIAERIDALNADTVLVAKMRIFSMRYWEMPEALRGSTPSKTDRRIRKLRDEALAVFQAILGLSVGAGRLMFANDDVKLVELGLRRIAELGEQGALIAQRNQLDALRNDENVAQLSARRSAWRSFLGKLSA